MAKEATTPNRKGSLSTRTREGVRNLFKEFKKDQRTIHVQSLNAMPAAERNSRLLQASTAMYRATKDRNFKPSPEQIKDFAAACEIIAEKRGIATQKDGTYPKEALNNELSPMALMQVYAAQTLKDSGENDAARQQIGADLKAGYGEGELPQEVLEVQQVPPSYADIMSDDDILAMTNEEERNQIIAGMSPLDQDRLNKKLEDKKKAEDNAFEENAGEARRRRDDPDWAKDDDNDNFKIEQGDIIDYLMKEVILASAAWAGNKAAGFVGIVGYEIISGVHHNATEPAWKKVKKIFSSSGKETDGNGSTPSPEGNNNQPSNPDILASFNSIYDNNKANYQKHIQAYLSDDPRKDTLLHYQERLLYNTAVIGENQIIEYDSTSKPFNEISSSVDVKKDFTTFRDNIRSAQLSHLKECYPGHDAEVEQWYKHRLAYEENCVLTKDNPTLQQPNTPSFAKDISARLSDYREQQLEMLAFVPNTMGPTRYMICRIKIRQAKF